MTRGKLEDPFSLRVDPASIPSVDEVLRRVEVGRGAGWLTPDTHEVLLAEEVKRLRARCPETVKDLDARRDHYHVVIAPKRRESKAEIERLRAENAGLRRLDAGYAANMALLSWLGRYHAEAEKARVAWAAAGPEFDAEDVLELVFDLNRWVLNNPKPGAGT